VVNGQHDGSTAGGIEDPGKPVLHPPIQGIGTLQKEVVTLYRDLQVVVLRFSDLIQIGHDRLLLLKNAVVDAGLQQVSPGPARKGYPLLGF
jgi:hypothetical protein